VSVSDIQTLRLYPMDETSSTWGVVMMRLQANLPDTLPGQNVTFLLFGDVELTSAVTEENSDEYTPMQAFYLATGLGDSQCAEAPESGLVVQTPDGVGEVAFNVNGVDISMGSTVQFQAQRGGEMNVRTLEGAASLTFDGESQPILAGSEIRLPLDQDLRPQGPPPPPVPYDAEHLPPNGIIGALDRPIEFAPPLAEGDIQQAQQMIAQGQPPCDDDPNTPFPTCDHIPSNIGGAPCTFNPEAHPDRPVCNPPEVGGDGRPCVMPPGPNDPPLPETETRPFCETGPDGLPAGTPPAGGQPPLRATRLPQLTPPAGGTPPLPSGGTLLPPPPGGLPPPPPPPGG
jgi:hypothetical protein